MKIIVFKGGLGNQIFQYAYYKFLLAKFPKDNFYGFFPKSGLNRHNGLEIEDVFEVELPRENKLINVIALLLFYLNKIILKIKISISIISSDNMFSENAIFHDGYWQNKNYYGPDFDLNFKKVDLGVENLKYLDCIQNENSVSVHIRRGDYLASQELYNICSLEYYNNAINIVKKYIADPFFVFFSDDINWVKENFNEERMCIIKGNFGKKSFIDVYLMSKCKAHIIANSTFSYWGAYLNKSNKLTIYPKFWFNNGMKSPDIAFDNWMEL